MKKLLLTLALLCFGGMASAQTLVDCAPTVTCDQSTGPVNTGSGDPAWKMAGKFNYDIAQLWATVFASTPATTPLTGAETVTVTQSGSPVQTTVAALSGFIPGSYTETQVAALFPPASYGGRSVYTTDFNVLKSDGIRWNVTQTPPIPAGAAMLGLVHNAYTIFPVFADIVFSRGTTLANFYAGLAANSGQPTSAAFGTDATTGQLELFYTSGNAAVMSITASQNTTNITGLLGKLPPAIGAKGVYFEAAYTIPTDNSDCFMAFFLQPWQHNAAKGDEPGGSFPAGYEQWPEFDINECGHGTDQAGFHRGTYINWAGTAGTSGCSWQAGGSNITLTANASGTGGTLNSNWTGDTSTVWNVCTSAGQNLYPVHLTNGSPTVSYGATVTGSPNATLTVGESNTLVQTAQTGALSYTTEHIFGGAYDPVGQMFYVWLDGTLVESYSTAITGTTNTFRDSLGLIPIFQTASNGAHTPGTMLLRYVSMWTQ